MQAIQTLGVLALGLAIGLGVRAEQEAVSAPDPWDEGWAVFSLADLAKKRGESKRPYHEFLDLPTLSAGLYVLPKGGEDRQKPHELDELYYVTAGKAKLVADGNERSVGPGDVIYVKAGVEHRFVEIEEELSLLVFFSTSHGVEKKQR